MGVCSSCQSKTAVSIAEAVAPTSTAKLVLEDATLQEFSRPVTVSEVLRQHQAFPAASTGGGSRHAHFVCDADGMGMEGALSALEAEEELEAGQLYFLLPLSMMRRRLGRQEMAELAGRACSALIRSGSGVAPLVFPAVGIEQRAEVMEKVTSSGRRVKGGASRQYLNLDLGVIPEFVGGGEEEEEEEEVGEEGKEEECKLIDVLVS